MTKSYQESRRELEEWRDGLRRTVSPQELIHAIENRMRHESDPQTKEILRLLLMAEHTAQGNEAAAAAVYDTDPVVAIHRWHDEWCRENRDVDIIPVLEERIRNESDPTVVATLRHILAWEYRGREDFASATAVCLDDFNATGLEMPLISLANQKFHLENQPAEALRIINQAFRAAERSGNFRRYALGTKARIALRLHDFRLMEDVLKQIMALHFTRGNADIVAERDFFDALPPGSIDPEVAHQYDEYCRARGKPVGADTPKNAGETPE